MSKVKTEVSYDHSERPANYSVNIVNRELKPVEVTVSESHVTPEGKLKLGYTNNPKKSPFPFMVLTTTEGKVKLFGEAAESLDQIPWFKNDKGQLTSYISVSEDGEVSYQEDMATVEEEIPVL